MNLMPTLPVEVLTGGTAALILFAALAAALFPFLFHKKQLLQVRVPWIAMAVVVLAAAVGTGIQPAAAQDVADKCNSTSENRVKVSSKEQLLQEIDASGCQDAPDTIYLQLENSIAGDITISSKVDIDLNGKSITGSGSGSVITVNGSLTLNDSSSEGGGTITGGNARISGYTDGGGVYVATGGSFTMNGGSISGNKAINRGGGVYVGSGCSFTMNGGTITGGNIPLNATKGGGVYVDSGGSFTMDGGTISGNTASNGGGGVYLYKATFIMRDPSEISGNYAYSVGGGVYVYGDDYGENIRFTMEGGTISDNHVDQEGGGVYVNSSGNFAMNGGNISNNRAKKGSGVYAGGTFTMTNSSISGNTATEGGGGVYVYGQGKSFTMNGGTISDNGAENGGGVYVYYYSSFTVNGGIISGNTANQIGGGVYVYYYSSFTMNGGTISGNTATANGGGVHLNYGTFTMSGAPVITGNTVNGANNNVYPGNRNITITGSLQTDSKIGVTKGGSLPIQFAVGAVDPVYTISDGDRAKFFDDSGTYAVALDSDNNELVLTPAVASVTKNGTTTLYADLQTALEAGNDGKVTLLDNIDSTTDTFPLNISSGNTVTLDLAGKHISGSENDNAVNVSGNLTLEDSIGGGSVTATGNGWGVFVAGTTSPSFTMSGGSITGSTGVYVSGGTFKMSGGSITGGEKSSGVAVVSNTSFTMSGGEITGGTGVSVSGTTALFTMSGGTITGGDYGVNISDSGTFTMSGGEIDNCTRGVVMSGGTFTMSGGMIHHCEWGVRVDGGTFIQSSGTIYGGPPDDFKYGVYMGGGTFTMYGMIAHYRYGVYVSGGTFTMSGSILSGGYGVYVSGGTFTMSGGNITGCDYGLYVSGGTFEMSGGHGIDIYQNTNNVYLGSGKTINITGTPASGSSIGVTMAGGTGKFARGENYTISDGDRAIFFSENPNYVVELKESELYLSPAVTLTYDGNGKTGGSVPDPVTAASGSKVTVSGNTNALSRTGYAFAGWNTEAGGTGTTYSGTDSFKITENTTLYAKWEAIPYGITVKDAANGSVTAKVNGAAVTEAHYQDTVTLEISPDSGYVRESLSVTSEGKEIPVTNDSFEMPAGDVTVEAKFTEHTHAYSFTADGNVLTAVCGNAGHVGETTATLTLTAPGDLTYNGEEKEAPVDNGIPEFKAPAVVYRQGGTVLTGVPVDAGTYTAEVTQDGVTASLEFIIAQKAVTVTADDKNMTEGETEPELTATVEGTVGTDTVVYSLSRAEGKTAGKYEITVTGEASQGNYAVTFVNGTFTINEKGTHTLTIRYDANGGSGTMAEQTVTEGTAATLTANAFTREHQTFTGWNTKADGSGTAYADQASVTLSADLELFAQWKDAEKIIKTEQTQLTKVPEGLNYSSVSDLNKAMILELVVNGEPAQIEQTVFVDVVLMVSFDNGENWEIATPDNFPEGGLEVRLDYPEGTGKDTHVFSVSHMFTVTSERLGTTAGEIEYPEVTAKDEGLYVRLMGLSPVAIAWVEKEPEAEPMDVTVEFVFLKYDGSYKAPFDIKAGTLNPVLVLKDGDKTVSKSGTVELEVAPKSQGKELPVSFSKKLEDLAPGKYAVVVSGLPKEMEKEVPNAADALKYKVTAKAEINKKGGITVYLIFDDGKRPEEAVWYPLPEDEIGAYWLKKDGTKEYLLFHTYDICMDWLGSDELCRGNERCYHKDGK